VLCDSRKFHQVSPVSFGEFHAAQIITDCMPDETYANYQNLIIV